MESNPLYKKDTKAAATNVINQANNQEFTSSTTDNFNKQLGQHGFLKHSKNNSSPYSSQFGNNFQGMNPVSTENEIKEQEPYRREAGRSLLQGNSQKNQERNRESSSINRRIVENNILQSSGPERSPSGEASFRKDQNNPIKSSEIPPSQPPQTFDNRYEQFYQNPPQKYKPLRENYRGVPEPSAFREAPPQQEELANYPQAEYKNDLPSEYRNVPPQKYNDPIPPEQYSDSAQPMYQNNQMYENQENPDVMEELKQQHNFYPEDLSAKEKLNNTVDPEIVNNSLDQNFEIPQNNRSRDQSLLAHNSEKYLVPGQIKYEAPSLQKSVQFQQQPHVKVFQDQYYDHLSRLGDQKTLKAYEDVGKFHDLNNFLLDRENVEQERYYARLRKATQKQNKIFQQHLNRVFIPQKVKEQQMNNEEEDRISVLKSQASAYEKQQKENIKTIKGEYSEFLSNQMKEKEYTQNVLDQEKKNYNDNIKMKYRIQEQKDQRQKREMIENQQFYRGVLQDQQRFKNQHPETSLKVNESPTHSGIAVGSREEPMNKISKPRDLHHYPSNSSLKNSNLAPQDVEPVGPVNANIGK